MRPGEFVGVDHPAGELRLSLGGDGRFRLRLAIWDPVVGAVAGTRELAGRWRQTRDGLTLVTPTRRLDYWIDAEGALVWRRSALPTFADGVTLVRRRA